MQRASPLFLAAGLMASASVFADVRELDGEEMVETYVQGISIGQPVVGESFASDDQDLREKTVEQKNALGATAPELSVKNAQALNSTPTFDNLVAGVENSVARDLVEDTIMQTSLSTRIDVNLDRVAKDTGVVPGTGNRDFSVLRGTLLELLPSATGYQFEFMKDRF